MSCMILYVFDMFHILLSGDSLMELGNVCMYVCMHDHLTISNEANCWNMVHCHASF